MKGDSPKILPLRRKVGLRERFRASFNYIGLGTAAFRLRERVRALRHLGHPRTGSDGLPLPPALLMIRVVGHADVERFERFGRAAASIVAETSARHGKPFEEVESVLDFGCGCGRVSRFWADRPGPRFVGTDYDSDAIAWCRGSLGFLDARVNAATPPLELEPGSFEVVYALSVFTHFSADRYAAWMEELRRVLRPGGLLIFSVKGDGHAGRYLEGAQLERYQAGEYVVAEPEAQGTNLCVSYAPDRWVRSTLPAGLAIAERLPTQEALMGGQDAYVARRD